jgi:dUTP pyrophosphatase
MKENNDTEMIINPSGEDIAKLFCDCEVSSVSDVIEKQEKMSFPRFEKVPYEQFKKDVLKLFYTPTNADKTDIPVSDEELDSFIKNAYDSIVLPKRSTSGSAGYDIVSPFDLLMVPKSNIMIPTGIRCYMPDNLVLMIYPRSGLSSKTRLSIVNTTPIIDSDYYGADNYGHMFLKVSYDFITKPDTENDVSAVYKNFYHIRKNSDGVSNILGLGIPDMFTYKNYTDSSENSHPYDLTDRNLQLKISRGDRIAQGIFTQYFITYDDYKNGSNELGTRKGGHGSTGK